jgi:uncharacterized protein
MTGHSESMAGTILKGVFYDSPVQGIEYQTRTLSGMTNEKGEFEYRSGETVTFSVGDLVLGSAPGSARVTPADLALEVGGDVKRITNQKVTNLARFLQSLDRGGDVGNRIIVSEKVRETVEKYRYKISFDQPEDAFTDDPKVQAFFADLGTTLRTPAQARNHLRRSLYGIKKLRDVRIPTRDGSYLLANIFRPTEEGRYPIVMSLGAYGKEFTFGRICNRDDLLRFEALEDGYFEGKGAPPSTFSTEPKGHPVVPHISENWELANTLDWVPRGYVIMRVDGRGVGKTPGMFEQFSLQEAKDFYDAIEWAGVQEWCNGNVGTLGASYYAMDQYNMSQLQPPHLKAMIPIAGDVDSYRDYIYSGGGLFNSFDFVVKNSCDTWQGVEWVDIAQKNPFDDPHTYGPEGTLCISADLNKLTVPFWSAMGTEGTIHTRGSSEAYIHAASKNKKLIILSEPGIHFWAYAKEFLQSHVAFFDYWLKGVENGIMDELPVKMMVRTGWTGYFWQDEEDWPIPRTQYERYYLHAAPAGTGDFLSLSASVPGEAMSVTYGADTEPLPDPHWSCGASFVTDPLPDEILIAGYITLVLWVSSTSHDMQIHAALRVLDENGVEIPYAVGSPAMHRHFPVAQGALKVSHRKLDPDRSTLYRPFHTHRKEDCQPLKSGEIVEARVELWPTTALVHEGHRVRLDVQPVTVRGLQHPFIDPADTGYQVGAANTIHTGPHHQSYIQLPVIPRESGEGK